MIGRVVCSKAGRDKGSFLAVVGLEGEALLVCDGKERPLERPKRKNTKHLAVTKEVLTKEQLSSNKSLRKALSQYRGVSEPLKEEN